MKSKTFARGAFILASLFLSGAFADAYQPSISSIPPAPPENPFINGAYLQADVGYGSANWSANFPNAGWQANGSGGFAYGGEVGYQWSRYLAAEAGAFLLAQSKFTSLSTDRPFIDSWAADVAGKLMAPIPGIEHLDAYFKAGIAYRNTRVAGVFRVAGDWRPLFAAGGQYNFLPNWYVALQWEYLGEASVMNIGAAAPNNIPAYNIFSLGVGYKFTF